ncbi:hypothetical protein WM40_25120 [Robbsia andropogonis]|uniref:Uncharacterized protein n=1 Tax=Robbsia andropogonis TaxID=28092 RepID=A0A0F5JTY4_9BURK|nr:hypothetical protein [Robbsia andropogonis]KKB61105.1 hypothetical protein WM40_25120 [Robbsia andropogonis]
MRWTFKRLVIWFVAFVVTGLGSSLYHSNLCTVLQIGLALILGLPLLGRVLESNSAQFMSSEADVADEERRHFYNELMNRQSTEEHVKKLHEGS